MVYLQWKCFFRMEMILPDTDERHCCLSDILDRNTSASYWTYAKISFAFR